MHIKTTCWLSFVRDHPCIAVLCPCLETIEPLDDSDVIIETLEPPGDNTPHDTYHDVKDYYYNSDSYNNAGTTRHPNSST